MTTPLSLLALKYMQNEIGQQEKPKGSNWGHPVQDYLASVGLTFPAAWCAALVYWSFDRAAKELGIVNPVPKTGGSLDMLHKALAENVVHEPQAGDIGIMDHGNGTGHTVIVENTAADKVHVITVEGNTNDTGSREGFEVEHKTSREVHQFKAFLRF